MAGRIGVLAGNGEDIRGQPAVVCNVAEEAIDDALARAREFVVRVPLDHLRRHAVHHGAAFYVGQLSAAARSHVVSVGKWTARESCSVPSFIRGDQLGFVSAVYRRDPVAMSADLRDDRPGGGRTRRERQRDRERAETDDHA